MIDAYAGLTHYADHLLPIWAALPAEVRGVFWVDPRLHDYPPTVAAGARPIRNKARIPQSTSHLLVAGMFDMRTLGRRRFILVEHGAGQTYCDPPFDRHRSYAGGVERGRVDLFLCPSQRVADLNLARYPGARAAVVGCPRLDRFAGRQRPRNSRPVVAFGFHYDEARIVPETRTAWPHYADAIARLVADRPQWEIIGHGHPRARRQLAPWWQSIGVEWVPDIDDVFDRADVFVADNSSALFEAAFVGIPVVLLNAPWYRRDVEHGLRFWSHAGIGMNVDEPGELDQQISCALLRPPASAWGEVRARLTADVYEVPLGEASAAAARAICDLVGVTAPA